MKTAVVTDSNSGIFGDEARELGIHVIPMPVIIDDHTYFENEDITQKEFFEAGDFLPAVPAIHYGCMGAGIGQCR